MDFPGGRHFEDFRVGEEIVHATPRTLTQGDAALYQALYGARFAPQSSAEFARALGFAGSPLDDLLVFHTVFGKSVPDISVNAVANLGYAQGRFAAPVFAGDTLGASSTIIGLKENSSGKTGVVYVRTQGSNQRGEIVLSYVRWVMVAKRDAASPAPEAVVPNLSAAVAPSDLASRNLKAFDAALSGSKRTFSDYAVGERIDHGAGQTIEEAEHQLATRLYQNTAKVHFDALAQRDSRFGKRLVYGGHIISIARALSFNGLENAVFVAGLNAAAHVAPAFAGDTVYAWSEVRAKADGDGCGFLRLSTIAVKGRPAAGFPGKAGEGYDPSIILDLDYWAVLPR